VTDQPFDRSPDILTFKDGEAFFQYQCMYGETHITPKRGVVALVLDARSQFGAEDAVKQKPDGTQMAVIRVAAPDGGFTTMAETPSPGSGTKLSPGDVVIWVPLERNESFHRAAIDPRAAWIGFIVAIVAPEINVRAGSFSILEQFA
jgi:hypothetical protein